MSFHANPPPGTSPCPGAGSPCPTLPKSPSVTWSLPKTLGLSEGATMGEKWFVVQVVQRFVEPPPPEPIIQWAGEVWTSAEWVCAEIDRDRGLGNSDSMNSSSEAETFGRTSPNADSCCAHYSCNEPMGIAAHCSSRIWLLPRV